MAETVLYEKRDRIEGWNSYTCLDPDDARDLLQQFHERTDPGRSGGG